MRFQREQIFVLSVAGHSLCSEKSGLERTIIVWTSTCATKTPHALLRNSPTSERRSIRTDMRYLALRTSRSGSRPVAASHTRSPKPLYEFYPTALQTTSSSHLASKPPTMSCTRIGSVNQVSELSSYGHSQRSVGEEYDAEVRECIEDPSTAQETALLV